jgi:hypothetical protein
VSGSEIAVVILNATPVDGEPVSWLKMMLLISAATFSQEMYSSSRRVLSSILTQFNLQSTQMHTLHATLEAALYLSASEDSSQLACTALVCVC